MYISRVEIDDRNRRKIKDLSHLGAYHNWVENCFPSEIAQHERRRHLWRIDQLHGKRYLLIVSEDKPETTGMLRYGVAGTAMVKEYQPFLEKITLGEVMQFRLTANPTYRTDGKVYPHITVDQQKNWLLRKAAANGFEIMKNSDGSNAFDPVSRDWPVLYHQRQVKISRVSFEGVLRVTDVNKFKDALTHGIGREKAYGMGMLTVIPLRK